MARASSPEPDLLKLCFLRELVQAARDPQAESFPLMELAEAIVNSAMTRSALLRHAGVE